MFPKASLTHSHSPGTFSRLHECARERVGTSPLGLGISDFAPQSLKRKTQEYLDSHSQYEQNVAMAKPRRGVKFNHRNGSSSGADGRRSSFSDISEAASEPGSPLKAANGDTALDVQYSSLRS